MAEAYNISTALDFSQITQTTDDLEYETNKRSLEGDSDDNVSYKKANLSGKSPMLKTMVPNHIAGSIIGKRGQTIAVMQEQTGAKIKLSSNNEFYPGTGERVVIISGELSQILSMLDLISEKIRLELPGRSQSTHIQLPERCKQIKLIVPNSTAGMIIGKGGMFIRGITEETGAKVQISQKSTEISGERVVTISGEADETKAAAGLVVTKCQDDGEHALNTNLAYSGYSSGPSALSQLRNGAGGSTAGLSGLANLSSMLGLARDSQTTNTANLLGQSNVMSPNQLTSPSNSLSTMLGMQQLSGHALISTITTTATYEMSVPDQLIGIILGRGGKTLSEFMQFSNANITISHKGEFITGTSNRKVVITGDPTSVQMAYFLITQKIMQETPK